MRVAALEPHPIVVEGVAAILAHPARTGGSFTWVGRARTLPELDELLAEAPDVVLLEPQNPALEDAMEVIARLTRLGVAVVLFTHDRRPVPIRQAVRAGALGVALKSDDLGRLLDVIAAASRGTLAVSSEAAFRLATDVTMAPELAPRELEVLRLLADGVPRKSVGSRLQPPVKLATVVTYVNRVCRRYQDLGRDIHTSGEAIRAALESGHLNVPGSPHQRLPRMQS